MLTEMVLQPLVNMAFASGAVQALQPILYGVAAGVLAAAPGLWAIRKFELWLTAAIDRRFDKN